MSAMNKLLISISVVLILFSAAGGYWFGQKGAKPAASGSAAPQGNQPTVGKGPAGAGGPPPALVEVSQVAIQKLPQGITAVGSLRSDESVILRPEVSGRIAEFLFKEGQRVQKGQVLVRLDSTVQRAELEQAKANLTLNKAKYDRASDLQKKGFISSQAKDEADNNLRVSQAAVEVSSARLSKLELKAPFAGIIGLRQVSVGDYVKDGQDIANIEEVDPLKVDFRVPEIYLKKIAVGQALQITLDAFPNQTYEGKVYAINPLVDAAGRSIVIRAQVKNTDARLRPGMFARVRLLIDESRDSMLIPEQALIPQGDEQYVFKVVDGRALRSKVEIGQRREGKVEILNGLAREDVVVIAGQFKIRDGVPVQVAKAQADSPPAQSGKDAPAPAMSKALKPG